MVFRCPPTRAEGVGATLQHLKTLWITEQGQVPDQMEESVNIVIGAREQALFPEL
jgi:hypothetical protein